MANRSDWDDDLDRSRQHAAARNTSASDESDAMLKALRARGPRPHTFSWAMMLCIGIPVLVLFLALFQLLR